MLCAKTAGQTVYRTDGAGDHSERPQIPRCQRARSSRGPRPSEPLHGFFRRPVGPDGCVPVLRSTRNFQRLCASPVPRRLPSFVSVGPRVPTLLCFAQNGPSVHWAPVVRKGSPCGFGRFPSSDVDAVFRKVSDTSGDTFCRVSWLCDHSSKIASHHRVGTDVQPEPATRPQGLRRRSFFEISTDKHETWQKVSPDASETFLKTASRSDDGNRPNSDGDPFRATGPVHRRAVSAQSTLRRHPWTHGHETWQASRQRRCAQPLKISCRSDDGKAPIRFDLPSENRPNMGPVHRPAVLTQITLRNP